MRTSILFQLLIASISLSTVAYAEDIDGGEVYANNCYRCHNAPPLNGHSDNGWRVVTNHMRTVADLTGEEAMAVVKFLQRSTASHPGMNETVSGDHGATLDGPSIVHQQACQACHVIHGDGGKVGPVLDGVFSRRSEQYIREHIENPQLHNATSVMPPHHFSHEEMDVVVNYLRDLK